MFKNQFPRSAAHFSSLIFIAVVFAFFFQAVPAAAGSPIEDQFVKDVRQAVLSGKRRNFWKLFNKVIIMEGKDTIFETKSLDTAKPIVFKK